MSDGRNFAWLLPQERIDLLAHELYKLQDILNRAVPGCREGETVFCLLTDLRVQCANAGAQDPFPLMSLTPRFIDTPAGRWPEVRIEGSDRQTA